jgi:hypothetical protein
MERDGNICVDVVIVSSRGIGVMVNVESIVGIKWPFCKSVIKLAAFVICWMWTITVCACCGCVSGFTEKIALNNQGHMATYVT